MIHGVFTLYTVRVPIPTKTWIGKFTFQIGDPFWHDLGHRFETYQDADMFAREVGGRVDNEHHSLSLPSDFNRGHLNEPV